LHAAAVWLLSSLQVLLLTRPLTPAHPAPLPVQSLLSQWQEKVARQLEFISELQSPTQRNSMMAVSAASAARDGVAGMRTSTRLSSFSAPLGQSAGALRASLTGEMVGGQQTVGALPLSRSSTVASNGQGGFSRDAAATSMLLHSTGFGSSISSASFAAGLGGGLSASAPNSPQLWEKAGGVGGAPRRSAFTPGPGLNGMGDASPGGGSTPR
jgi:hypothetical protein